MSLLKLCSAAAMAVGLIAAGPAFAGPFGPHSGIAKPDVAVMKIHDNGYRHRRHFRRPGPVVVDAPTTYVETYRDRVWVDAPFAVVRVHPRGVWVRAPYVNLYVPR